MTEIPEDVMKAAREAAAEEHPVAGQDLLNGLVDDLYEIPAIARAILAERQRAAKVAEDYRDHCWREVKAYRSEGLADSARCASSEASGAHLIAETIRRGDA